MQLRVGAVDDVDGACRVGLSGDAHAAEATTSWWHARLQLHAVDQAIQVHALPAKLSKEQHGVVAVASKRDATRIGECALEIARRPSARALASA